MKCPACGSNRVLPDDAGAPALCLDYITVGTEDAPHVTSEHPQGLVAHRAPCGWKSARQITIEEEARTQLAAAVSKGGS